MNSVEQTWKSFPIVWRNILLDNFKETEEYELQTDINDMESYALGNLLKLFHSKAINCAFAAIDDIEPVGHFTQLEKFDMGDTLVSDVSPLKHLSKLQKLDLMFCKNVADLTCLESLHGLRMVELSGTSIDNLEFLSDHRFLFKLACKGAPVDSLKPLKAANRLRELSISSTAVSDLSPVFHLKNLKMLSCGGGNIDPEQIVYFKKINPNCKVFI